MPGRGLFLPSMPDLGMARLVAGCRRRGLPVRVVEGTWYWVNGLLSRPERILKAAAAGRFERAPGERVENILRGGVDALASALRRARQVLVGRVPEAFFDVEQREEARELLEFAYSIFEWSLRRFGPGRSRLVRGLVRQVLEAKPRLVAFSLRDADEPVTRFLIWKFGRLGFPLAAGGWFTLGMGQGELALWRRELGVDWLVAGPGEEVLPRLAGSVGESSWTREFLQVGPWALVAGPDGVFHVGDPHRNGPEPLPEEDWELLLSRPYHAPGLVFPVASNRGCYWARCAFCPQRYNAGGYREHRPEEVAERVVSVNRRYGARRFFFVDECIRPGFAEAFLAQLERLGAANLAFVAMARPERAFTDHLLEAMASRGFRALLWGVESASDRVLRLMRKGTRQEEVVRVLESAHRAGIWNYAFLMVGFPGETPEEARATLEFVRANRSLVDGAQLSRFVVYESSEVGRNPEAFGLRLAEGRSRREVGAVDILAGGANPKDLDQIYLEFVRNYGSYVSGRVPAEPHSYSSAWALIRYLFEPRSKQ